MAKKSFFPFVLIWARRSSSRFHRRRDFSSAVSSRTPPLPKDVFRLDRLPDFPWLRSTLPRRTSMSQESSEQCLYKVQGKAFNKTVFSHFVLFTYDVDRAEGGLPEDEESHSGLQKKNAFFYIYSGDRPAAPFT